MRKSEEPSFKSSNDLVHSKEKHTKSMKHLKLHSLKCTWQVETWASSKTHAESPQKEPKTVSKACAKPAPPRPPTACQLITSCQPEPASSPSLSKRVGLRVVPARRPPADTRPMMAQPQSKPTVAATGVSRSGPSDTKGPMMKYPW